MELGKLDRRRALILLGVATVVSASSVAFAGGAPRAAEALPPAAPTKPSDLRGIQARGHQVTEVSPLEHGALQVTLTDASGDQFVVDVCARDFDDAAPRGPARTPRFELFLLNSGSGETPTNEAHGLAAMALAAAMEPYEASLDVPGLMTLRERLATHGSELNYSPPRKPVDSFER